MKVVETPANDFHEIARSDFKREAGTGLYPHGIQQIADHSIRATDVVDDASRPAGHASSVRVAGDERRTRVRGPEGIAKIVRHGGKELISKAGLHKGVPVQASSSSDRVTH